MDECLGEGRNNAMSMITLKGIIDEDFVNYKVPSMTLMFPKCNFKCGKELCQNNTLINSPDITIPALAIYQRYSRNDISSAIVCQGMDPMDSYEELLSLIRTIRWYYDDDIVIYTGYDKDEICCEILELSQFKNIIVKYGRYMPGQKPHYDDVLGVYLASDNQYAERIS